MSSISSGTTTTTGYVVTSDTTGALVLKTGASGTTAVTIGSDQSVTFVGSQTLSGGTANGVLYLNGSKVLTSGSALTFNGTNLGVGSSDYGNAGSINLSVGVVGTTAGGVQLWSNTTAAHSIQWGDGTTGSDTYRGAIEYSHTGDSMRFYTSATERMRLDSSGNLGLGVTPSAWFTGGGYKVMQIGPGMAFDSGTDFRARITANGFVNSSGDFRYLNTGFASNYNQASGEHKWFNAPSGTAGNAITFTQAMILDASGNLGVGTTSASSRLHVSAGNGDVARIAGTTRSLYFGADSGGVMIATGSAQTGVGTYYSAGSDFMYFMTGSTERARIDTSGNLLVGTTSSYGGMINFLTTSGRVTAITTRPSTNITYNAADFQNSSGTGVGGIGVTNSSTNFSTSSDYRLKNTIAPMTGALARVAQLKPVTYKWNVDGSNGEGFIAHELAEIVPQAVTGEKDAVDEEGNPQYQGIDASFLVATLTAAIQELKSELDSVKAELAALKGN